MLARSIGLTVLGLVLLLVSLRETSAEMGPCRPNELGTGTCGSGNGAALIIYKTMSPSGRFAVAWRLTDRPPTATPDMNDPNLENFVVRISDGAILARSRGTYWDLGDKIAKAFVFTAWSPNSRLLAKIEQREETSSAEVFAFAEDDRTIGPFELVDVIKPVLLGKMGAVKEDDSHHLVFLAHPAPTIDNQGLMHIWAQVENNENQKTEHVYDATVQVSQAPASLTAQVVSAVPYPGPSISIIVH